MTRPAPDAGAPGRLAALGVLPQMTAARATGEDSVEVDARHHGREQHGEASFHADGERRPMEWASPSGYRGWTEVAPDGDGSRLTLFLNTLHGSESDHDVAATLDAIRMLVEAEVGSTTATRMRPGRIGDRIHATISAGNESSAKCWCDPQ
jgi:hypothetical protein